MSAFSSYKRSAIAIAPSGKTVKTTDDTADTTDTADNMRSGKKLAVPAGTSSFALGLRAGTSKKQADSSDDEPLVQFDEAEKEEASNNFPDLTAKTWRMKELLTQKATIMNNAGSNPHDQPWSQRR